MQFIAEGRNYIYIVQKRKMEYINNHLSNATHN